MRQIAIICTLIFLCAGCSKDEVSLYAPFVGAWTGNITNKYSPRSGYSVTLQLDNDVFLFTGGIIPDYKYFVPSFDHPDIKEGEMILLLHNSTPNSYIVKAIFNPLEADRLYATVDIRGVGKYEGILLRKF